MNYKNKIESLSFLLLTCETLQNIVQYKFVKMRHYAEESQNLLNDLKLLVDPMGKNTTNAYDDSIIFVFNKTGHLESVFKQVNDLLKKGKLSKTFLIIPSNTRPPAAIRWDEVLYVSNNQFTSVRKNDYNKQMVEEIDRRLSKHNLFLFCDSMVSLYASRNKLANETMFLSNKKTISFSKVVSSIMYFGLYYTACMEKYNAYDNSILQINKTMMLYRRLERRHKNNKHFELIAKLYKK